jgi:hypothetical protein
MGSQTIFGLIAVIVASVSVTGCWKKSGQAVVLEKEHIATAEPTPTPAPAAEQSASPNRSTPSPSESPANEVEYETRELAEDEIAVDTYVMKKEVRGTSRDPRATRDEQWIVNVQMIEDLRQIKVRTDQRHYDKLKVGDRVKVSYRQGKYTGTVWSAEIE